MLRRAGAIIGSTSTFRGAWGADETCLTSTPDVRSRHPHASFPALGTPPGTRHRGKETKGEMGGEGEAEPPPILSPTHPISPHREIPGEPRGDPQHVVQHQHGSEAALPQHTRGGQLVGQRQPAHLDHSTETGKCSPCPAPTALRDGASCSKNCRRASIPSGHELIPPANSR